jgi:hypothetical protein
MRKVNRQQVCGGSQARIMTSSIEDQFAAMGKRHH